MGLPYKDGRGPSPLGGSWVVLSGIISPLIRVISIGTLLITLLITTHEPPSRRSSLRVFKSLALHLKANRHRQCRPSDHGTWPWHGHGRGGYSEILGFGFRVW